MADSNPQHRAWDWLGVLAVHNAAPESESVTNILLLLIDRQNAAVGGFFKRLWFRFFGGFQVVEPLEARVTLTLPGPVLLGAPITVEGKNCEILQVTDDLGNTFTQLGLMLWTGMQGGQGSPRVSVLYRGVPGTTNIDIHGGEARVSVYA